MTKWQWVGRFGTACVYAMIGAIIGFLFGYFFVRPFLMISFWPEFVQNAAFWAPHVITTATGLLAAAGYLKSDTPPATPP